MYSLSLSFFLAIATATPIADLAASGQFTLNQEAILAPRLSLPEAIRRDYLRHGLEVPDDIEEVVQMNRKWAAGNVTVAADRMVGDDSPGTTTVEITPGKHDVQFLMNMQVGKHKMIVDLDTGSSDLWVISDLLAPGARGQRPSNKLYDTKGGGKELRGSTWKIMYGDRSSASGKVYEDKVTIGSLSVEKQAVEAASDMSIAFLSDNSRDGLLGLGFITGNMIRPKRMPTWFDNVREKLKSPVFTCSIKRGKPGSYDFGFVDKEKYSGEIGWANVKGAKSHWDFNMTGYAVGAGAVKEKVVYGIADTGSSLWYMPDAIVDEYWKAVPGAKFNAKVGIFRSAGWSFPCAAKLPNFTIVIGGKKIVVDGINLNYAPLSSSTCQGGLQHDLKGAGFSLFGDTFLKGLFVVFEAPKGGQARLGVAKAV